MAYLDTLYTKKSQYENLRPALLVCKNKLITVSSRLTGMINVMWDCLVIDGKSYRQSDIENQKTNIDNKINTVDSLISRLDASYDTVCSQISQEEARLRNSYTATSSSSSRKASSSKSSSSKNNAAKSSASKKISSGNKTGGNKKVKGYTR